MADNSSGMPGSGEQGRAEAEGHQPAPPDPQPAQQTGRPHLYERDPAGRDRTCIIIGIAAGCGCLVLILVLLLAFGVLSLNWFEQTLDETENTETHMQQGPSDEIDAPDQSPIEYESHRPGRDAAMNWAKNRRADWRATVDDYSEDWSWVRVLMAPSGSDWTTWVELRWDGSLQDYRLLAEGPIAQDAPGYEEEVPEIFRPGEQVAREAALSYVEEPDWVTRIDSNTADWTEVSVSVGPPASEWIWLVNLQWNPDLQVYDLVSVDWVD